MILPPDYEIMSGCISNCEHCQLPFCPFDLGFDVETDHWEDEDDFSDEEIEEGECEGVGDDPNCPSCPHWGGEGLCCLSLSQFQSGREKRWLN